ncbi:hypothetical protein [Tropicibacter alexandrii]|uniref:hypothetical protein n=1 Tax=Tropicibacter alexandrii TaxID=2267683 RepID=UPI000EF53B80|nr:hypothetical protein [Tropicibacter alexandrii]
MFDPADARFLTALHQVLAETDSPEAAPCQAAARKALDSRAPLDLLAAREGVHALPRDLRDRILAQVHARMAGDLSAIWDLLPHAPGTPRSH